MTVKLDKPAGRVLDQRREELQGPTLAEQAAPTRELERPRGVGITADLTTDMATQAHADTTGQIKASTTGAQKLGEVTEARVREMVNEIAEVVRATTGLTLDVSRVKVEVLDKKDVADRVFADAYKRMGVTAEDVAQSSGFLSGLKASMTKYAVGGALAGAYLPSEGGVVISRQGAAKGNEDSLREVLYHELIHAAQAQTYPEFFQGVADAGKAAFQALKEHGKKSDQYLDAMDVANARMTFMEGHPTFMQKQVKDQAYPASKPNLSFTTITASLVMLASREGRMKIGQYVAGDALFKKLAEQSDGGKGLTQLLYQQPQLIDLMLRTRGTVTLEPKNGLSDADTATLVAALRQLGGKGGSLNVEIKQPEAQS